MLKFNVKLKVLTLNCFGAPQSFNRSQRFEKIGQEIMEIDPNITALQEVYFSKDRSILLESLNSKVDVYYSLRSLKRTTGGLITGVSGIKSKYMGFIKFDDQGPIAFLPIFDRLAPKGFQHIKLLHNNKIIDFINVHLICIYKEKQNYRSTYSNQINQLIKYVKVNCGNDMVLAGDLNGDVDSEEIIMLKSGLNLYESLTSETITVSSENTNRKGLTNIYSKYKSFRTDYVFTKSTIKNISSNLVFDNLYKINNNNLHLSDHYGILTEIEI